MLPIFILYHFNQKNNKTKEKTHLHHFLLHLQSLVCSFLSTSKIWVFLELSLSSRALLVSRRSVYACDEDTEGMARWDPLETPAAVQKDKIINVAGCKPLPFATDCKIPQNSFFCCRMVRIRKGNVKPTVSAKFFFNFKTELKEITFQNIRGEKKIIFKGLNVSCDL